MKGESRSDEQGTRHTASCYGVHTRYILPINKGLIQEKCCTNERRSTGWSLVLSVNTYARRIIGMLCNRLEILAAC